MYKNSWKAALMTLWMTGVGRSALAAAGNTKGALDDVPKTGAIKASASGGKDGSEVSRLDITNLQDQVAAIGKQTDDALQGIKGLQEQMPADLTMAVVAVAVFALVLALLLFMVLRSAINREAARREKEIRDLREELEHHKRLLSSLNSRLEDRHEPVTALARQPYRESSFRQSEPAFMQPAPMPAPAAVAPEVQSNPSEMILEKCSDFVREYNRIQTITGRDALEAKKDLQRKYDLVGLVCVNATERINHQEKPPQFQLRESLVDASIWGLRIESYYVVVPNPRSYVGDDHEYGGMKELFKSNFQSGQNYKKIKISHAAIMTQDLQIRYQGEIQLS